MLEAPQSRAPKKEACFLLKEKASLPFSPRHSVVTTVKNLAYVRPTSHKALRAHRCLCTPVCLFLTQRGSAVSSLKVGLTPVGFFNCLRSQRESPCVLPSQDRTLPRLVCVLVPLMSADLCCTQLTSPTGWWVFWFHSRRRGLHFEPWGTLCPNSTCLE